MVVVRVMMAYGTSAELKTTASYQEALDKMQDDTGDDSEGYITFPDVTDGGNPVMAGIKRDTMLSWLVIQQDTVGVGLVK